MKSFLKEQALTLTFLNNENFLLKNFNQIHGHGMVPIKLMIQNSSKKNLDLMKMGDYSEIVIWATILKNQYEILRSREKSM